jgi:hypothetical protein
VWDSLMDLEPTGLDGLADWLSPPVGAPAELIAPDATRVRVSFVIPWGRISAPAGP